MKKEGMVFALIFIFILFLHLISSVEFEVKDEYARGETLLAKVSGNFLQPILSENINFYRGHVKIPMVYDIAKINNQFYIYAQLLGKEPGNYSIVIKDVRYMKGAETSQEDIIKNFIITNKTADFKITPGFIIASNSFFIEVQNLQDKDITIGAGIKSDEGKNIFDILFGEQKVSGQSIDLISGETQKIYFDLNNLNSSILEFAEIETDNTKYEVPIYVILNETPENKNFRFTEDKLGVSLSTDFTATRTITLENNGDQTIENINLYLSDQLKPYVNLSKSTISNLKKNESVEIVLNFSADNKEKTIEGQLIAESEENYVSLPISLTFTKNFIPEINISDNKTTYTTSKNCSEINGTVCGSNKKCDGQSFYTKDGNCCMSKCAEVKKSSTGKIIGWLIVVVLVIFVAWFFKSKYKGASRKVPF